MAAFVVIWAVSYAVGNFFGDKRASDFEAVR